MKNFNNFVVMLTSVTLGFFLLSGIAIQIPELSLPNENAFASSPVTPSTTSINAQDLADKVVKPKVTTVQTTKSSGSSNSIIIDIIMLVSAGVVVYWLIKKFNGAEATDQTKGEGDIK